MNKIEIYTGRESNIPISNMKPGVIFDHPRHGYCMKTTNIGEFIILGTGDIFLLADNRLPEKVIYEPIIITPGYERGE